jgi:Sel1 repeat
LPPEEDIDGPLRLRPPARRRDETLNGAATAAFFEEKAETCRRNCARIDLRRNVASTMSINEDLASFHRNGLTQSALAFCTVASFGLGILTVTVFDRSDEILSKLGEIRDAILHPAPPAAPQVPQIPAPELAPDAKPTPAPPSGPSASAPAGKLPDRSASSPAPEPAPAPSRTVEGIADSKHGNVAAALATLKPFAEAGEPIAQYWYARALYKRPRSREREELAAYWFEQAARNGVADAQSYMGMMARENHQYSRAFEWYSLAAHQGFADAQYHIGLMHYHGGQYLAHDPRLAYYWFFIAATNGHDQAQHMADKLKHGELATGATSAEIDALEAAATEWSRRQVGNPRLFAE